MAQVFGLITARAGSKELPNKNILPFRGKPLIWHSINASLQANCIDRTIVSTDSSLYAEMSREFGAEVPFIRPEKYSNDEAQDGHVYQHFISCMDLQDQDIIVHLRPTNPRREEGLIDSVYQTMFESSANAIRTISSSRFSPYKMVHLYKNCITSVIDLPGKYLGSDLPRQLLQPTYELNGNVDIFRVSNIAKFENAYPENTLGYLQSNETLDIDTHDDFISAQMITNQR